MAFQATVVQVMIASPSDVPSERSTIRSVLGEWNDLNAERERIVLLPVAWESHAVPQMGARAQDIINRDVLARCDLLVAAFWTRLGSPTGESPSGTVEEIRKHIADGKLAMVYFSEAPVRMDSVDDAQYKALREFRKECEGSGLIETYETVPELRDKLLRHLTKLVIGRFAPESVTEAGAKWGHASQPRTISLSLEAKILLKLASQDPSAEIEYLKVGGGPYIQTRGRPINKVNNPRSRAIWEGALRQLVESGLVEDRSGKGEIFGLTSAGFEMADTLPDADFPEAG